MSIKFVNQSGIASGSTTTSLLINYIPVAGNYVFVFLSVATAVTNVLCQGNNGSLNIMIPGPVVTNGINTMYSWYLPVLGGYPTTPVVSFLCSWTSTSQATMSVEEFTGVVAVDSGFINSGTSSAPSLSITLEEDNDYLICAFGDGSNTLSVSVGTELQVIVNPGHNQIVIDNTGAAGSITCSATLTGGGAWVGVGFEARTFPLSIPEGPTDSGGDYWLGGDYY